MSRGTPDWIDTYDPGLFPFVDTGITNIILESDIADGNIESLYQIAEGKIGYVYLITIAITPSDAFGFVRCYIGEEDTTELVGIFLQYVTSADYLFHVIPFPKPLRIEGPKRLWIQSPAVGVLVQGFVWGFTVTV